MCVCVCMCVYVYVCMCVCVCVCVPTTPFLIIFRLLIKFTFFRWKKRHFSFAFLISKCISHVIWIITVFSCCKTAQVLFISEIAVRLNLKPYSNYFFILITLLHKNASRCITLRHAMTLCVTQWHFASHYVTLCHVMSLCVTLWHFVSRYVTLNYCVIICQSVSLWGSLCHSVSRCATQLCVMLRHAASFSFTLCHSVTFCAVLCLFYLSMSIYVPLCYSVFLCVPLCPSVSLWVPLGPSGSLCAPLCPSVSLYVPLCPSVSLCVPMGPSVSLFVTLCHFVSLVKWTISRSFPTNLSINNLFILCYWLNCNFWVIIAFNDLYTGELNSNFFKNFKFEASN